MTSFFQISPLIASVCAKYGCSRQFRRILGKMDGFVTRLAAELYNLGIYCDNQLRKMLLSNLSTCQRGKVFVFSCSNLPQLV